MRHCKCDVVNGTVLIWFGTYRVVWAAGKCWARRAGGLPPYEIGELNRLTAFLTFQTFSDFSDSGSGGDLLLKISARRYWISAPASRTVDGVSDYFGVGAVPGSPERRPTSPQTTPE